MSDYKEFLEFLKERDIKVILHFPHVGLDIPKYINDDKLEQYWNAPSPIDITLCGIVIDDKLVQSLNA